MGATSWQELSLAAATNYAEGLFSSVLFNGYAIIGLVVPITNGLTMLDATTAYTELSISATASTELSISSTAYTELTL